MIAVKSDDELHRSGPFLFIGGQKVGAIRRIGNTGAAAELDILLDGKGCCMPTFGKDLEVSVETPTDGEAQSFKADVISVEANEWTSDLWVKMAVVSEITLTLAPPRD